jgi:hypothetical protein
VIQFQHEIPLPSRRSTIARPRASGYVRTFDEAGLGGDSPCAVASYSKCL